MSTLPISISYRDFVAAKKCLKRFWLNMREVREEQQASDISLNYQFQHKQLLEIYKERFTEINFNSDSEYSSIEALVENQAAVFVNAKILNGRYRSYVDILKKEKNGCWSFVLIKAASGVKDRYLVEAAFIFHMLSELGCKISACTISFVSRKYTHGSTDSLLVEQSSLKQVKEKLPTVHSVLKNIESLVDADVCPDASLMRSCIKPMLCPHYHRCWQGLSEFNILSIPHMKPEEREQYFIRGVIEIDDINEEDLANKKQRQYVQLVKKRGQRIDVDAIASKVDGLEYPLYFLDFEADNPAVPKYPGQRAFMKTPFQFSCHRLSKIGELQHYDYLHADASDPRPLLIDCLLASIEEKGSVVVWHADFERSRLNGLAEIDLENKQRLRNIAERLWDMEPVFIDNYVDYRFKGSSSLKSVIKALVPELSYDDLAVKDGEQVMAVWNQMLVDENPATKEQAYDNIKAYCERDTLAMVEIYRHLLLVMAASIGKGAGDRGNSNGE